MNENADQTKTRTEPKALIRRLFTGGILVLVGGYLLFHYVLISEEERVRRAIHNGAEAVEARSIRRVSDLVAMSYADSYGMDKRMLVAAAERFFENFGRIEVEIEEIIFEEKPVEVESGSPPTLEAGVRVRASVVLYREQGSLEVIDEAPGKNQWIVVHLEKRRMGWQVNRFEFVNVDLPQIQAVQESPF
jgi:hypothetical protein